MVRAVSSGCPVVCTHGVFVDFRPSMAEDVWCFGNADSMVASMMYCERGKHV